MYEQSKYFSSPSKEHAYEKYLVVLQQLSNYAGQYLCGKLSPSMVEFFNKSWLGSVLGLARIKLIFFVVGHMVLCLY